MNVREIPIQTLAGLADRYYLSETGCLDNSVGLGPTGLELRGRVKVTQPEIDRIERFMAAARYNIAINNCEHFANYVVYGLNLSSQQHVWWKSLGAEIISFLQPTQNVGANYNSYICHQISEVLEENLFTGFLDVNPA